MGGPLDGTTHFLWPLLKSFLGSTDKLSRCRFTPLG